MNALNNEKLALKKANGINIHLYSDDHPETTLKGTGFKDAVTALRTIELVTKNKPRNRQIWTINAMYYRAKHHPYQTPSMREAMEIFQSWMDEYKAKKGKSTETKVVKKKKKKKFVEDKETIEKNDDDTDNNGNNNRPEKAKKRKKSESCIDDDETHDGVENMKVKKLKKDTSAFFTENHKETKHRRLELERQYKALFNETLPKVAKAGKWPIYLNHCLMRVALDAYWQCCWYEKLNQKKGALKSMSAPQIENVILIGKRMTQEGKAYVTELNERSLFYRGKKQQQQDKVKKSKFSTLQVDVIKTMKHNGVNEQSKQVKADVTSSSSITVGEAIIKISSNDDETNVTPRPDDGEEDNEYNEEALLEIQRAVSGRASCRGCKEKILKGEYRVGMKVWSSGRQIMVWHRPSCFLREAVRLEKLNKNSTATCKYTGKKGFRSGDLRLVLEVGMTKNYYYAPNSIGPILSPVFQLIRGEAQRGEERDNNNIITPQSLKGMDELEKSDKNILISALQ